MALRALRVEAPTVAVWNFDTKPRRNIAGTSLDEVSFPLGRPERLNGGTIADLGPEDHLVVPPGTKLWTGMAAGVRAKLSIAIVEPKALHRRHMFLAWLTQRRFHSILTCNEGLLGSVANGIFFPFGGTWVPEWRDLDLAKTRNISLIASAKRDLTGHKLRHEMVDWIRSSGRESEVDIAGRGYRPLERKSEGLASYRYSLVIENVREKSYFTEKLIDAFLCRTVPIYWGAPDIGDFFDTDGMIICETMGDLQAALDQATPEDYASRLAAMERNFERAIPFADLPLRLARAAVSASHATSAVVQPVTATFMRNP